MAIGDGAFLSRRLILGYRGGNRTRVAMPCLSDTVARIKAAELYGESLKSK